MNSALTKTHICAECEFPLVERWNPATSQREIKCGNDKSHEGFIHYSESKSELERKGRQMVSDNKVTTLAKYSGVQKLSESQAVEVVGTLWPGAPDIEKRKAILLCVQYGLNPLRKHLFLVPYSNDKTGETSWEIIMGITAKRQMTRDKVGAFSYVDDTPRLMSKDEQMKYVGEVDETRYWAITKLKAKDGSTAQGYGFWAKTKNYKDGKSYPNTVKGADKGNSMQNMAMIHSESAALERLSGESMPTGVTVADEHFIEAENGNENGQLIDGETGEIIEGGSQPTAPVAVKTESTTTEPPIHVVSTHVGPAEPPKQAPEGKQGQGKLGQEDVDRVSRALAAAGWLPEKRPELYEGKWFKTNFPGFTTIPDMSKADAERLIRALELAVNPKQAKAPAQSRIMDAESGEAF